MLSFASNFSKLRFCRADALLYCTSSDIRHQLIPVCALHRGAQTLTPQLASANNDISWLPIGAQATLSALLSKMTGTLQNQMKVPRPFRPLQSPENCLIAIWPRKGHTALCPF